MAIEIAAIEVSIGRLPKWYFEDEGNHDALLEDAIERHWQSDPTYADVQIEVNYNYNTEMAIVKAYDDDGNLIFERDNHDYGYALDVAKKYYDS